MIYALFRCDADNDMKNTFGKISAGASLVLCCITIHGATPYASISVGWGSEAPNVSVAGVNHPTRCDSKLYASSSDAPTDAACVEKPYRKLLDSEFDLGFGFSGAAAVGLEFNSFRIEAEFLQRSYGNESVPAIAGADNQALIDKGSEWSPNSPPRYDLSGLQSRHFYINLHYAYDMFPALRPFVGVGIGSNHVSGQFGGSYVRKTLAEGYVTAAGGDPAHPEEWQLAAAGTISELDIEFSEDAFGYQLFIGAERLLNEQTLILTTVRWLGAFEVTTNDLWNTVRSHAPVQADGSTPFRTDQTLEELGGIVVSVGLRHQF